jgi:hypothetical protein
MPDDRFAETGKDRQKASEFFTVVFYGLKSLAAKLRNSA